MQRGAHRQDEAMDIRKAIASVMIVTGLVLLPFAAVGAVGNAIDWDFDTSHNHWDWDDNQDWDWDWDHTWHDEWHGPNAQWEFERGDIDYSGPLDD